MIERRSTNLAKPIFYFSLEIILMVELMGILFAIYPLSIFVSLVFAIYIVLSSSIPRLIKILDRIVDMRLAQAVLLIEK